MLLLLLLSEVRALQAARRRAVRCAVVLLGRRKVMRVVRARCHAGAEAVTLRVINKLLEAGRR
jgi:hypothetical protein